MRVPRVITRGIVVLIVALSGLALLPAAAQAATDVGHQDVSFSGGASSASGDKPESKLWLNDGIWWADLFDTSTKAYEIYRLDTTTQKWTTTGTRIDTRPKTLADTLWDGTHLYVASHVVTVSTNESPVASASGQPAKLYRYSYNSATRTYSPDSGFPVNINNNSSESFVIDKASDGTLWATWTQVSGNSNTGFTNSVYYNHTVGGDGSWGTPAVLPVTGAHPSPDDISSVIAYKNFIGIIWSDQLNGAVYWAAHSNSSASTTWTGGVAEQGPSIADDHLNVKSLASDGSGRVFAVVKTSLNDVSGASSRPQVQLLVFTPGTGSWKVYTVSTIADCSTRPILVLDQNQIAHVYMTEPDSGCSFSGVAGSIYEKATSMNSPSFASGRGTVVMRDGDSANLNDASSLKQSQSTQSAITQASGLVVLATNNVTKFYWHSYESLGGTTTPTAPTAAFSASATSGAPPLAVTFADNSTGGPTAWSWNFGDGGTSTLQNPSHTFAAVGTYTVTLTASNSVGSSSSSKTITVSKVATGAITFRSGSSVSNATAKTVVIPAPSGIQSGDFVLAAVTTRGAPTITAPSGWTLVRQDVNGTTGRQAVFSHRVGASEPASFTFTLSSAQAAAGVALDYAGVSSATPIDVSGGHIATAASRNVSTPAVTTTASDRLVGIFGIPAASSLTAPTTMAARGTASSTAGTYKATIEAADVADSSPGATSIYTAASGASTIGIGQLVALRAG